MKFFVDSRSAILHLRQHNIEVDEDKKIIRKTTKSPDQLSSDDIVAVEYLSVEWDYLDELSGAY